MQLKLPNEDLDAEQQEMELLEQLRAAEARGLKLLEEIEKEKHLELVSFEI